MKILFSGHHNPYFWTLTEYLESAIRRIGHELVIFEDRRHIIPGRVRKRLSSLNLLDLLIINKRLTRLAKRTKPDISIVTGGYRITGKTVSRLKAINTVCILWTIDAPRNFQPILNAAPFYDHIFCQGTEAIELLLNKGITGVRWLPMGCDPDVHYPVSCSVMEQKTYGSDIVFVGSYYPNRAAMLEPLTSFNLTIYGPGWNELPIDSKLRPLVRSAHIRPDQWRSIYNASKIVLSIHYQDPLNRFPVYQASPRVFEAMACGAFVLTDRQKDVLALFEDERHLATFSDGNDLVKKINYYLNHDNVREKIAAAGRQEVLANHTYVHRLRTLFEQILPPS